MSEPLAFITEPTDLADDPARVFQLENPDRLVLCFYCHDDRDRGWVLNELRLAAGRALAHPEEGISDSEVLARHFAESWSRGSIVEALRTLIHWRTRALGRGYHTYVLRRGDPPYPWGVILAFRELDVAALRRNRARAEESLEGVRTRVMDIFSWGVETSDEGGHE